MNIVGTTLEMIRGDSETLTYWNEDELGVAPLVTGDTVYFTVKIANTETAKQFQKVITTFVDGKAIVNILPADTKNLEFGRYVYDFQVNFANGDVKTPVIGQFVLLGEVTYE